MPAERVLLAQDEAHALERVHAPSHGNEWGDVHLSPNWRWILPGSGGVEWRSGAEHLVVDELTAFHLRAGDGYQLRHPRSRTHLVLSTGRAPVRPGPRAWLLDPRGLLEIKLAERRLQAGVPPRAVAATVAHALARGAALDASALPPALLQARRLIASNAAQGQPLDDVAAAAGCSPFQLSRLFRHHVGCSPHQYRLRLRMAVALQRLQEGERDLAGLAHDLGFSSQSHFGQIFRREVGVTPAQGRQLLAR